MLAKRQRLPPLHQKQQDGLRFEEEFIGQLTLQEQQLPSIGTRWLDTAQTIYQHYVAERDNRLRQLEIHDRMALIEKPAHHKNESAGDNRLRTLRYLLNNMGIIRSADQVQFHDAFIKACLPLVYGPQEWETQSVAVLVEFGLKSIQSEVLIMTPR